MTPRRRLDGAPRSVRLAPVAHAATDAGATRLDGLAARTADVAGQGARSALDLAVATGESVPVPGSGATLARWEALATVAAVDLVVARVLEPHLDALALLAEARSAGEPLGAVAPGGVASWGVWAAEGPGARLVATEDADGWRLHGRKPWCSLAGLVTHALVTAWVDDDERRLFSVDLAGPGVVVEEGAWSSFGLAEVVTSTVACTAVAAQPVGGTGWYLRRDGFAWGGIGVAAVWFGGAVGLARRLLSEAGRRPPDQLALAHLGAVDASLAAARSALVVAAADVDAGRADGAAGALLAARVRQVVADAAEQVVARVRHALGPGPLAHEPDHARRLADLELYLRQHHAERDQARLGALLLEDDAGRPAW